MGWSWLPWKKQEVVVVSAKTSARLPELDIVGRGRERLRDNQRRRAQVERDYLVLMRGVPRG